MTSDKLPSVFMYGGGRQTVAIIGLILDKKIPMPDVVCIADTGREKSSTWEYLDNVIRPAFPQPIYRIPKEDYATVDLYRHTKAGETYLLIPAFTKEPHGLGKLETYCSNEWKLRVCDRFLKKKLGIHEWVSWIGFSADEPKRFTAKRRSMGDKVRFPLVDDVPMTKQDCVDFVKARGWPEPKHSACWMCPLQDDQNWLDNSEADMKKAVELDAEIRKHDPNVFLHRTLRPIGEVEFISKESKEACDSGVCML